MIEHLSEKIIYYLVKDNYIQENRKKEFVYGLTCFVETCISTFFLLGIGVVLKKLLPTIMFMIFFAEIKKRCGSFHANTYIGCLFSSALIYVSFVVFISPLMIKHMLWTICLLFFSFLFLEIVGAVNHPGVGWLENEYRESKRITRLVVLLEVLIITTLYFLQVKSEIVVYLTFAVCLNAILLLIAKLKEKL